MQHCTARFSYVLLIALVLVGLSVSIAQAVERPFHLEETGQAVFAPGGTVTTVGTGQATHLGRFVLFRTAALYNPSGTAFKVDGEVTIVAANGDQLYASIEGTFDTATGQGTLIYAWTGGTGRFQNATGTTIWVVSLNTTDFSYAIVADGVIDY